LQNSEQTIFYKVKVKGKMNNSVLNLNRRNRVAWHQVSVMMFSLSEVMRLKILNNS
jgi:hypothetical protein